MLATLLVLSVLHLSPVDAPRLDSPRPRPFSLLTPAAASPSGYGLLSHEHVPGVPSRSSPFSFWRVFGEFVTGFGSQLVVGTGLWAVEVIGLFGATVLTAAFTGGSGTDFVLGAGTNTMIFINGAVLPLLGALPIWLIASTDLGYTHSFLGTWLSGVATYATWWVLQTRQPSRHGGLELITWPAHVGSWLLTALVQTVVINLTKEERSFASRALSPALLHVEGARVRVGAPLPALAPDGARPGRVVPVFSLAQGRF